MALFPLSLAGLSAQITELQISVAALQAATNELTAEVGSIKASLATVEMTATIAEANVTMLSSQVTSLDVSGNIVRSAMAQAISSLALMVEEIRSGNVGSVPAEMADLLSALSRIDGQA